MNEKKTMKASEIEGDDVDDIIGIAAEMMQDDEGKLTPEQMREVGAELDIPVEYIERAREELEVKRKAERKAAAAKRSKTRTLKVAALLVAGVLCIAFVVGGLSASDKLNRYQGAVKDSRAQLKNVIERKAEVEKQWQGRANSPDRDAEISGANNRVRVEKQRLNTAITRYNTKANTVFGRFATLLTGFPGSMSE